MNNQYQKDITFLESLSNIPNNNFILDVKDRKIFLKRLSNFLSLVNNPQDKLKVIHIAGTSGKGTTVNILQNLMMKNNLRVGSYTSPFATTSIEKLRINNKLISPKKLHKILEKKIKPALDKYVLKFPTEPISYFEAFLALGLIYFKEEKCDYIILETGLGGTHDATNIIKKPLVTAITNIGLDHTEILGDTKEKIAKDKAGIIKPKSIFLTTEKNKNLIKIFKTICKKRKAKYTEIEKLNKEYNSKYFSTPKQKNNLNLALNILKVLNIQVKNKEKIINKFQLLCRQEIIQSNPLVILDGAHNPDKLGNLITFIKKQYLSDKKKVHLILGLAHDKKYKPVLKKLLNITDEIYLTRFLISLRKSASLKKLYKDTKIISKIPTHIFNDPYHALDKAMTKAKKNDIIIIAGSFYLTGELRKHWISEKYILKNLTVFKKRLDKR